MIMASALLCAYVSSDLSTTQVLNEHIVKHPVGKRGILIRINLLLVILSYFISPADVIFMVNHLLIPIIKGLGFVPTWFAVIITANLEIGLATPPAG